MTKLWARFKLELYYYSVFAVWMTLPIIRKIRVFAHIRYLNLPNSTKFGRFVMFDAPHNGPNKGIKVGDELHVSDHCYLDCSGGLTIGHGVTISEGVSVFTHEHDLAGIGSWRENPINYHPIEICGNAWIGAGAKIMPSVKRIGNGAVVAAGAIVTKDVLDNEIVAGNPAKSIGRRHE